jgi:hypothetical protein
MSAETFGLTPFVAGLQRAAAAVALVEIGDRGLCTGWFVTPTLLVIPQYAVEGFTEVRCRILDGTVTAEGELVHAASQPELPALIRLHGEVPVRPLDLHQTAVRPGEQLLLVHYPRGVRETQLSMCRTQGVTGLRIAHDGSSEPGSGGGPLLSAETFGVVGIHMAKNAEGVGLGSALDGVLADLRRSSYWAEIAQLHRLADVGAARDTLDVADGGPDARLLPAALRWSFDPQEFPEDVRAELEPFVGDPDEPAWTMFADERRRQITAAGSLAALAAPHRPGADPDDPGQRTIDRIIAGPPYDLTQVPDEELPHWLQATGWFADVVPALPTPATVHRVLDRRRSRGRLKTMAGDRLWGRDEQLTALRSWYAEHNSRPLAVTGIGGLGKTALIAAFALGLPERTPLLWLDFDRADLAPDDAVSVLTELAEQTAAQVEGAGPAALMASDGWEREAERIAHALDGAGSPPLLVLDGFEVAQHVPRYDEIWVVLEKLLAALPSLRVVLSGRARVPEFQLAGRPAATLDLPGLDRESARAWLADKDITDPATVEAVIATARGVPLVVKLAARLIRAGGDVADLPHHLVEGYLYQRILERVVDSKLRPLARDALVLRRITAEIVGGVLADRVPEGMTVEAVFVALSRELAVVDEADRPGTVAEPLRLRPEVRTATLRLLEIDDPERVSEIDRRASWWYGEAERLGDEDAAELVYHSLRRGDIGTAEAVWRPPCAVLLLYADEEIPDVHPEARTWLQRRTIGVKPYATTTDVWEYEALERIRKALRRGNERAVEAVLKERPERSPESPLTVYDAWCRWVDDGDIGGARRMLAWPVNDAERLLAAKLACADGDRRAADGYLRSADVDRALEPVLNAARIRLSVDLAAELDLLALIEQEGERLTQALRRMLYPGDVVTPRLQNVLQGEVGSSMHALRKPISVPDRPSAWAGFIRALNAERHYRTQTDHPALTFSLQRTAFDAGEFGRRPGDDLVPLEMVDGMPAEALSLGLDLAVRSTWRWSTAVVSNVFRDVAGPLTDKSRLLNDADVSSVATLAVFAGQPLTLRNGGDLQQAAAELPVSQHQTDGIRTRASSADARVRDEITRFGVSYLKGRPVRPLRPAQLNYYTLSLYAFGPQPIDILYRRVLGLPDRDVSA